MSRKGSRRRGGKNKRGGCCLLLSRCLKFFKCCQRPDRKTKTRTWCHHISMQCVHMEPHIVAMPPPMHDVVATRDGYLHKRTRVHVCLLIHKRHVLTTLNLLCKETPSFHKMWGSTHTKERCNISSSLLNNRNIFSLEQKTCKIQNCSPEQLHYCSLFYFSLFQLKRNKMSENKTCFTLRLITAVVLINLQPPFPMKLGHCVNKSKDGFHILFNLYSIKYTTKTRYLQFKLIKHIDYFANIQSFHCYFAFPFNNTQWVFGNWGPASWTTSAAHHQSWLSCFALHNTAHFFDGRPVWTADRPV